MPEPKFTDEPPTGSKVARARGPVTPPDAEDVVASTAPDDDLADLFPDAAPEKKPSRWKDGDVVLIHVLEDGFTANGRVWYRGQEIEYTVGDQAYKDTCNIHGESWLELDAEGQFARFGKLMFNLGPWPGGEYENKKAQAAERERNRKPPTIGKLSNAITRS